MEIRSYFRPGLSVIVELDSGEVRNLRKEFEDFSRVQKPTVYALLEEILDYADEDD